ncbi:RepB family protein [Escherichia coli]|uniref:RepB family protein n=1 Tax=Escherichia coli TaxID=562 RepID=UPI002021BA53|nr:RepB family protein [Escherichia coli]
MPAFEWVHVQLHQQKGMISLSPPTICNSAKVFLEPKYKAMLMQMCNEDGLTQAEVLTALIKSEAQKRCM